MLFLLDEYFRDWTAEGFNPKQATSEPDTKAENPKSNTTMIKLKIIPIEIGFIPTTISGNEKNARLNMT